jgi:squalene cyclase
MLVADQDADGSWKIDTGNTLGSPATYGTPLATWMALRVMKKANLAETKLAAQKADRWLRQLKPNNLLAAATLLLASAGDRAQCLALIRRAQARDGGWGPYADSPPEAFDTAMVLLALAETRREPGIEEMIRRGRAFLLAQQNADGSWPATTRPSGEDSYAQMMSTTGWATLALLATKE